MEHSRLTYQGIYEAGEVFQRRGISAFVSDCVSVSRVDRMNSISDHTLGMSVNYMLHKYSYTSFCHHISADFIGHFLAGRCYGKYIFPRIEQMDQEYLCNGTIFHGTEQKHARHNEALVYT